MTSDSPIPEDLSERILFYVAVILQILLLTVLIGALQKEQWLVAFTGAIILALTFAPALIERQFGLSLPVEFTFLTCVFLYASFGLGEYSSFYARFWWWDLLLHSFSALVMGLTGFLIVYVFHMTHKIQLKPVYVAAVSFGFAVTIGAVWEVFEFLMDWMFGFNMQKSGLVDTMTDMIVDIVGALLAAFIGYSYVKDGDSLIADRFVRQFIAKNPHLFHRKRG